MTTTAILITLMAVTPICLWVIFTDLKYMKIRNAAVFALLGIFLTLALVSPFSDWMHRWINAVVTFPIMILLYFRGGMGAGDVKFATVAALFIDPTTTSLRHVFLLLPVLTLAALTTHNLARRIPMVQQSAPDWVSWRRHDFPFGIVLAGTLWFSILAQLMRPLAKGF